MMRETCLLPFASLVMEIAETIAITVVNFIVGKLFNVIRLTPKNIPI